MVTTKSIFVLVLCAVAQLAFAATIPVGQNGVELSTNAARMAAGLNPLTPRGLGRRHPPSPPSPPTPPPAPSPRPPTNPTPPPPTKRGGTVSCKRNGVHIGWVGRDFSSKDNNKKGFGLCNSKDKALAIDFDDDDSPKDIRLPNHGDFPFLGWSGNNLNSDNSCVLTKTRQAPRGGPQNVGNAFSSWSANSESSNWTFGKNNNRFSFDWVNSGGAKAQSKTFYNPDDDCFHLVSDGDRFQRRCPRAFEVEFGLD